MYINGCQFGLPFMMGGGMFMWIIGFLIVIGIVWFFSNRSKPSINAPQSTALNILNEKYAQGEISEDEYLSKKQRIQE